MENVKNILWLALILILMAACTGVTEKQTKSSPLDMTGQNSLKVLFIGNSYTYVNDLPWLTQQLAVSAGEPRKLETEMVAIGGATLKSHWERGEALQKIRANQWDYVVLQEQSTLPIEDPDEMYQYARLFDAEIKHAHAQTVFYLTWARQNQPETQQALTDAYLKIARELGDKVAPVGIVWQKIQAASPPLNLYFSDGSHPSPIGSYVAACVFYATLYGKSPVGLSRRIYSSQFNTPQEGNRIELDSLSETDAQTIQRSTWDIISENIK